MTLYSIVIGCVGCVAGLWVSYELDIPSGASIVVISVMIFLAAYLLRYTFTRSKRKELSVTC
jgi:zinc transport system permease protein